MKLNNLLFERRLKRSFLMINLNFNNLQHKKKMKI